MAINEYVPYNGQDQDDVPIRLYIQSYLYRSTIIFPPKNTKDIRLLLKSKRKQIKREFATPVIVMHAIKK